MDEWYTYQRLFSCFVIVFHSMFNILFQFYIYHTQMIVLLNQVNWSEINRQETKQGCWVCVYFFTGIDFVSVSSIFLLDFGKDHTNLSNCLHFVRLLGVR